MKNVALMIAVVMAGHIAGGEPVGSAPASLPVTNGLVCWYDAGTGVAADSNGVVKIWNDLSGNDHFGTPAAGAAVLAANQINSKPVVQFRTGTGPCGLNLDGPFFVEEVYVVVRSPNGKWNSDGCFLGRRWGRSSCYRLARGSSAFWGDQYPVAVSRNGTRLSRPFDLGPITDFMIIKIDVNDGDMSRNSYQIGMADGASCDFDVAEMIGYANPLSPSEEAAVGSYLAAKYGIGTSYSAPAAVASAGKMGDPAGSATDGAARRPSLMRHEATPALVVTNGLICWYDAGTAVRTDSNGVVLAWNDRSGNGHHGTPGAGAPVLALNRVNSKPVVKFRGGWLALAGKFFAKEQYVVVRSPAARWSGTGSFLGRMQGRRSSWNTWGGDTGFWTDQSPVAVTRNGVVLPGPAFDCSPLTNYMVLRIVVNDNDMEAAGYAIGNNDGLATCDFEVAEILGYQTMLSPTDEDLVGAYLATKYGLRTEYPPLPVASSSGERARVAAFQYKGWQQSGSLYLLTMPEGADLPATASEKDFPVLVRLDKDWFHFNEAKASGEDIRFATATGEPLAYQIDNWDSAAGTAAIWVRIPAIMGNARQELKMYWGRADAASESSGPAVFNRSNGYLSVWHMNEPVKDDAGTLESKDMDTMPARGTIGQGRHFPGGRGIACGDRITTYPFASGPHTSEAWIKAGRFNTTILSWGKHDTVSLRLMCTPAQVSAGGVRGTSVLPKSEWVHVVYAYNGQNSRIYVNGQLDVPAPVPATMNILSPVSMGIGRGFIGEIDEVRISRFARSADWVKLEYENQKPMQTLAGLLVQPGAAFSISEKKIVLPEGRRITVKTKAGGAEKVYWIIKSGGAETVEEVDRFNFTMDAGRVTGDKSFTLQFKAIYSDGVKTQDIPVTIREDIPDPVFTLKAPSRWDGRETIEVVTQISNVKEMQSKSAGELKYDWTVPPMVEAMEIAPGKLILKRSRSSGKLVVTAAVSNGGKPVTQSVQITVSEPATEVWVQRAPSKDEKPVDNQFYASDNRGEGTLFYNGSLSNHVDSVFLKLYAGDNLIKTEEQNLAAEEDATPAEVLARYRYAFTLKLKPGLIRYKVEFGTMNGKGEMILRTVTNLVCGDAYVIDGQSNAEATQYGKDDNPVTSEWLCTYNGGRWQTAAHGGPGSVGYWGLELARSIMESRKIPICIINGAVGGTRIDQHMPNLTNRTDATTIYGRLMQRVEQAGLTHGIRGVFWHQGEADQGTDGPDGGYGWETYQQYFLDLSAVWKRDMPNIGHYYIYQIWPNACGQGGNRQSDMFRDVQRLLPRLYSNMSVMSTLGIKPEGSCHYPAAGYAEMAMLMTPLVERDNYGQVFDNPITAPDLRRAYFTSERKDEVALEFDQPMKWTNSLVTEFYLDGGKSGITEGSASGNVVKLKLVAPTGAKTITYLVDRKWDPRNLLYGQNNIAALTFCEVPLSAE